MSMRIKLADFGLAYQDIFEGQESQFNVRWAAPEIWRRLMETNDYGSDDDDYEYSDEESSDSERSQNDMEETIASKSMPIKDTSRKDLSNQSKSSKSSKSTHGYVLF